MSGGNRNDGPALVALGLLLIAVVLVAPLPLLDRAAQTTNQQVAQPANGQEVSGQPPEAQESEGWRLLDPYAQWIMASFAAFATGASVVGIVLLRRTFEETKRTADAAFQAIGTERAWMTYARFDVTPTPAIRNGEHVVTLGYKVTWRNSGRSPATDLRMYTDYKIVFPDEPISEFAPNKADPQALLRRTHVGAGDPISTQVNLLTPEDSHQTAHIVVYCWVEYRDLYSAVLRTSEMCSRIFVYDGINEKGEAVRMFDVLPVGPQNRLT